MTEFYHHHNVIGMTIAIHRYEPINAQQEAAGLAVKYGPPAVKGIIQTEDIYLHTATGVYIPRESFPAEVTPGVKLEDAITQLYKARGIERKEKIEKEVTSSAARTCG